LNGPDTAGLVIQPFQTVCEDILICLVGQKRSVDVAFVNPLSYLLYYMYVVLHVVECILYRL